MSGNLSGVLQPQRGVGLALWVLGWLLGLAALVTDRAQLQGMVAPGWAGDTLLLLCPSTCPHTHSPYFCHIFRGLFFIPDAICSSAGADRSPLGEETLLLGPECLLHGHQPPSMVGQDPPAPSPVPRCSCGAASTAVLGGSRDMPVTLGWAEGVGTGVGGGVFFCSLEMCPMYAPLQLGMDGGIVFYLARERPAK